MRIGLFPIILAAGLALGACEQNTAEEPAEDITPATTLAAGAATGETCGGFADPQCRTEGDFCKKPVGQCGPDAQGTCTTPPTVCTRENVPVCGCDGQTYSNACEAEKAGINVQSTGACEAAAG